MTARPRGPARWPDPAARRDRPDPRRSCTCPLVVIGLYAFNAQRVQTWPIQRLHARSGSATRSPTRASATRSSCRSRSGSRRRRWRSCSGTLASFAVHRYRVLRPRRRSRSRSSCRSPCPGSSPAWRSTRRSTTSGSRSGTLTIIVGHATFCVVVVYNNVIARLRRTSRSIEEASADLGADTWQTFRYVTFPVLRTALRRGRPAGLRPVVRRDHRHDVHGRDRRRRCRSGSSTTLRAPNQRPIVNVVALVLILRLGDPGLPRPAAQLGHRRDRRRPALDRPPVDQRRRRPAASTDRRSDLRLSQDDRPSAVPAAAVDRRPTEALPAASPASASRRRVRGAWPTSSCPERPVAATPPASPASGASLPLDGLAAT